MTTIARKNFTNMDPAAIPVADEYIQCNFTQHVPDTSGAQPKGVRLFPGDDTPRIFRNCNLVNCEPPPISPYANSTRYVYSVRWGCSARYCAGAKPR